MSLPSCSPRALVALATFGSAAALAGALAFQVFGGLAPCHLCVLQRWPHLAAVVIGVAILVLRMPMAWALIGALAALTTSGLGLYHSLVERHLIAGPDSCTLSSPGALSATDLLDKLQNAPLVRCDAIPWEMFGVTMANLNAVFSLLLAVIWVLAWLRARRMA